MNIQLDRKAASAKSNIVKIMGDYKSNKHLKHSISDLYYVLEAILSNNTSVLNDIHIREMRSAWNDVIISSSTKLSKCPYKKGRNKSLYKLWSLSNTLLIKPHLKSDQINQLIRSLIVNNLISDRACNKIYSKKLSINLLHNNIVQWGKNSLLEEPDDYIKLIMDNYGNHKYHSHSINTYYTILLMTLGSIIEGNRKDYYFLDSSLSYMNYVLLPIIDQYHFQADSDILLKYRNEFPLTEKNTTRDTLIFLNILQSLVYLLVTDKQNIHLIHYCINYILFNKLQDVIRNKTGSIYIILYIIINFYVNSQGNSRGFRNKKLKKRKE